MKCFMCNRTIDEEEEKYTLCQECYENWMAGERVINSLGAREINHRFFPFFLLWPVSPDTGGEL